MKACEGAKHIKLKVMVITTYQRTLKRSKLLTATLVGFYIFIAIVLLLIKNGDSNIRNSLKNRSPFSTTSYSKSQSETGITTIQNYKSRN